VEVHHKDGNERTSVVKIQETDSTYERDLAIAMRLEVFQILSDINKYDLGDVRNVLKETFAVTNAIISGDVYDYVKEMMTTND
jgi:hypothetical protein